MATFDAKPKGSGSGSKVKVAWDDVVPVSVDNEDTMSAADCAVVWEKMYTAAEMQGAGEKERQGLRAAVYVYGALNATSRVGNYGGKLKLADGRVVDAAIIPASTGRMAIRRFFRANMAESYEFFKTTGVMSEYPRFVAKVAEYGISATCAFAVADWLTDCPNFTPEEGKAHNAYFTKSLERAVRARGGRDLGKVEDETQQDMLAVQGPLTAPVGKPVW